MAVPIGVGVNGMTRAKGLRTSYCSRDGGVTICYVFVFGELCSWGGSWGGREILKRKPSVFSKERVFDASDHE